MTNLISKMTDILGLTGDGDKVPGTNENEQVDRLTCQVEQTNLEAAKKSPYCALEDLMESWKEKGSAGDTCPRTLMVTACSVVEHPPVQDKGYFVLPGDRLQASLSERVKTKPSEVLRGPKGCGYQGCRSNFFESIGAYIALYPQVLKCQSRQPLHDVVWADPEVIGCLDHTDSSYWSHVLMTVKLVLIFLEKQLQAKYRGKPHLFRVCKVMNLGVKPDQELDDTDFWMPLSFRQLLVWGKCRDFQQDMELDGVDGLPQHLIDFATSLKGVLAGSMSGPGTGPPKVGARALKVK